MRREEDDPQVRVLHELSSMILHILRTPPLITLPYPAPEIPSSSINPTSWRVSPVMFAALFLGISVALMLFGSIIFVIGLILLPWIIALVLIFFFAGIVSTLLGFGHAFLCWAVSPRDVSDLSLSTPKLKWWLPVYFASIFPFSGNCFLGNIYEGYLGSQSKTTIFSPQNY